MGVSTRNRVLDLCGVFAVRSSAALRVDEIFVPGVIVPGRPKICSVSKKFLGYFGGLVLPPRGQTNVALYKVVEQTMSTCLVLDQQIIEELQAKGCSATDLSVGVQMMVDQYDQQEGYRKGPLDILERSNIFYARDNMDILRVVSVVSVDDGWDVDANPIYSQGGWEEDSLVFQQVVDQATGGGEAKAA